MKEIDLRHAADHIDQRAQISHTKPRVDIYGNEFKWSKRNVYSIWPPCDKDTIVKLHVLSLKSFARMESFLIF